MNRFFSVGFWETIARIILRNRITILVILGALTIAMAMQWKHMRFSYTEANLLPKDHPVNSDYEAFLKVFGEEGNLIVLGVQDEKFWEVKNFEAWQQLVQKLQASKEVSSVISIDQLYVLHKDTLQEKLVAKQFLEKEKVTNKNYLSEKEKELYEKLPFYEGLIYNAKSKTIRSAVYLDKAIVNTEARKIFIDSVLIPEKEKFEVTTGIQLRISGMPYVRTLNSQNIIDEIGLFVVGALLVTSLIFFFFFRSFRATFISMCVVIVGVMWAFGTLGLFRYEITVLTAIIPPLIIVIGIPNCIFLINKYQQEVKNHGNQAKSLQRVVSKIGNATLMTNLTTASGFATFMFTNSQLLKEFGIVASINIVVLFLLCITVIPIIYSFMSLPKERHLEHLNRNYIASLVRWFEHVVKNKNVTVYVVSILLLVLSIIGIYQMRVSGSLIEDMPRKADFFKDIRFFEQEFEGIMPLEILIDTKKEKGVQKMNVLKRMDRLQETIDDIPELSKSMSVVNLVKYGKQAYYNGNPEYYELPTSQEVSFILPYVKNSSEGNTQNLMKTYVDSTGRYARITTFMKDIGSDKMEEIQEELKEIIIKEFPSPQFEVAITGKAYLFQKGTEYLINNLVVSLILAIVLISLFMAYLFRSFKMIVISLVPNLLPLLITAGIMGFFGVPLKPSTILVFSIAFGISVDDTIHFLAKYRQELKANNWKIRKSVFNALRETGVSMFYTSIVLFFGFSVFMISSFGGTVALGGLVSLTLVFAMFSNLILLPTLLLSLEKNIANEKEFIEPKIDILPENDSEDSL